jgi:2-keto-4-pentenoate hydratase
MRLTTQEQALLEIIRQARASKSRVMGKDESRGVDLEGAYRITAENQGARVLKGYKLGLISAAKQEQMGISTPLYGPIYADMIYQDRVSLGDFIQPRFEPEVAATLRDDIPANANAGIVQQAVGGYFLGIDILDSIWDSYKFTAAEVAADNTSGGGFLLGGQMMSTVPNGALRLYMDGELQVEGHTEALGNPIQNLQWLAQTVGGLTSGMTIFFGSPAASIPAKTGTLEVSDAEGHTLIAAIVA